MREVSSTASRSDTRAQISRRTRVSRTWAGTIHNRILGLMIEVKEEEHVQIPIRRKVLSGVAALVVAVPVGIVASLFGPTVFSSAAGIQDPSCAMSPEPRPSTRCSPTRERTRGRGRPKRSRCRASVRAIACHRLLRGRLRAAPSDTSVQIAATKVGAGKAAQYLTGYCPGFASTNSLKALKNVTYSRHVERWRRRHDGHRDQDARRSPPTAAGEAGFAIVAKY